MNNTSTKYENALSYEKVSSLTEFIKWVATISKGNMLFRGMANADWNVESSLYRRLKFNLAENIDINAGSILFLEMTQRLLDDARQEGHGIKNGQKLNDLELLADLQHYSAATCLIDFTKHSLIALCFACETTKKKDSKEEKANGKVVAFNSNDDSYNEISIEESKKSIDRWLLNERFWILPPKKLNKRITHQQSVFVFGNPTLSDEKLHICEIEAEYKEGILEELKQNGISAKMLFDDFVGFSLLNSHDKKYEHWDTDSDFVLEIIHLFKGEFKSTIDYCDKEIKSNPKNYKAHYNRGFANSALGNFLDAINDFNEVINLNSKDYIAYHMRGTAKSEINDKNGAINDFNEAINLNSTFYQVHFNRGLAKSKLGDKEGAAIDFANAKKLNPELELPD